MDLRYSRLTINQRNKLFEHFVAGSTARTTAELVGLNRNTVRLFFHRLREVIAEEQEKHSPFDGEIELDESYFGGIRKGKRGRGAAGKVPVFGLLKRGGKVYTAVVPDTKGKTLKAIIINKIQPDSIVYTDSYRSYNVLDVSEFKHYRINHSFLFADKHNHINGIENFWGFAKRRLKMYHGGFKKNFPLFMKEMEFRFNQRDNDNVVELLTKMLLEDKSGPA
jgi:transposase